MNPQHALKWDAYRILDLYYLFPDLLGDARLPRNMTTRKRAFSKMKSKYSRVPSPSMFIQQMSGIHELIGRSLAAKGFLSPSQFESKVLSRTDLPIPKVLNDTIHASYADEELVALLAVDLAALPLTGIGGLKERTGLLEHRYDAV